ncbi:FHA domain-containing protein [Phthorimaea operculella]|nr:FHA domain-containing protein [Phthorimaea operculella]
MKSKKRHQSSSEESEESDASVKSSSSSDSESEESSESDHRHKKKRKRDSSHSESDSDDQKRSKKRKHKKKKKKHSKKKRRSDSVPSISVEEISLSEGELSSKKKRKHKHKHSKRERGSSASEDSERVERRLHSVVKERRASSEEDKPSRTYYPRESRDYRQSESGEEEPEYERVREVQRFYRGSSKERAQRYQYERERTDKYASYQDKNYQHKYGQSVPYKVSNEDYSQKQKQYDEYRRHHQRYDDRRPTDDHHSRPRQDYHSKEDPRGYNQHNRYNQHGSHYEGPKRQYNDHREYQQRRGPPEPEHYREREYPDKREKYQDKYSESDTSTENYNDFGQNMLRLQRPREPRHSKPPPPVRSEKPIPPPREYIRPSSQDEHYKSRRPDPREDREDRYRESGRGDAREGRSDAREGRGDTREIKREREESRDGRGDERASRSEDRRPREDRPPVKPEARPRERKSRFQNEDNDDYSWGKTEVKKEGDTTGDKEKPNFGLSGKLTADTNTVNGVVIKYSEPDDAKQPKRRWRFYPFKGETALPILYIHRQSAFLIGRDKKVVDIILEHPSISKQHAALQYRATPFERPDGTQGRRVRPYIIDLDSANGTFVNNKKIEPRRYVELLERDVVKFGFSQREYVLLHENSKDDAQDDDNQPQPELGAAVTLTEQVKQEKRMQQETLEDGE